jgi:Outer membrane lipoprotein-sorting protein
MKTTAIIALAATFGIALTAGPLAAVPAPGKPRKEVERSVPISAKIPASADEAIAVLNDHINNLRQMSARFEHVSPTGRRARGTLSYVRPASFRFVYDAPATLEILSDGKSIAIRDSHRGVNEIYSVDQTPLRFLVKERIDFAKDTRITGVDIAPNGVIRARFEDTTTLTGTNRLEIEFDAIKGMLRKWTIDERNGGKTTIVLSDVNVVMSK